METIVYGTEMAVCPGNNMSKFMNTVSKGEKL